MRRDKCMKAANMYVREWNSLQILFTSKEHVFDAKWWISILSRVARHRLTNEIHFINGTLLMSITYTRTHAHIHKHHSTAHTGRVKPRVCSLQFRAVRPLTQHFSTNTDEHMPNMVCACYLSLTCKREIQSHLIDIFICVCVVLLL